jgi:hypothetical protein
LSKTPTQLQYQFNSRNSTTTSMASYSKELGKSPPYLGSHPFELLAYIAS